MERKEFGHNEEGDRSPERPDVSEHNASQGDDVERREDIELRDRRTEEEATKEIVVAKEQIAEATWRRPVEFVGDVFNEKLVPYVKRFLEKFSTLDDDALPDADMRKARDKAREATEQE